jgi:cation/acetate symporter
MILIAEPLRNLGRNTFSDVVAFRLQQKPVRVAAAFGGLAVVAFYLIAQMVGAGNLIQLMFGLPYEVAVVIVGVVMLAYVLFGGMLATTWVQIIKAGLLLGGATLLALLVLAKFSFSPLALFSAAAARYGSEVLAPGALAANPWDALSLGLALMFGTAGLPHILMRFYTVPNARTARLSVFYATGLIGYFYLVTFVLGFGAAVLVGREAIVAVDKGGNMAAPLLAAVAGGTPLLGFISAVAFATILAVVAGLTLSGAASLSHDLWVNVVRGGEAPEQEQLKIARLATVLLGLLAIALGIVFKRQNVAFMVGLAFAIAASANLPALLLAVFWRPATTMGAASSIIAGTSASLLLIALSPTVQIDILHHASAAFPLKNPALVTLPLALLTGVLVSLVWPEKAAHEGFAAMEQRAHLGPAAPTDTAA